MRKKKHVVRAQRTALKNAKKKFINAVQAGDNNAEQLLNDAYKAIDKAVAQKPHSRKQSCTRQVTFSEKIKCIILN